MKEGKPSMSAQQVAMARAHLTHLGVVDDPYASAMLRPPFAQIEKAMARPALDRLGRGGTLAFLAARTLAFDQAVNEALDAGAKQVVIVGAGYDSRAWRLARPGVRYFEVDHPATQADKQRVAPSGSGPTYVAVDLDTDSVAAKLRSAGLATAVPTVFSAEGLTMYLTEARVRALFAALTEVAGPNSKLVANFGVGFAPGGAGGVKGLVRKGLVSMRGEPLRFEPSVETATGLLGEAGWTVTGTLDGPELGRRYLARSGLPTEGLNPAAFVVRAAKAS